MEAQLKLSDIMGSPEREQCMGRLLSTAFELERSGYKSRHISLAAISVAFQYAHEQQQASEYRFTLEFIERLARKQIVQLDQITADWKARGCPAEG